MPPTIGEAGGVGEEFGFGHRVFIRSGCLNARCRGWCECNYSVGCFKLSVFGFLFYAVIYFGKHFVIIFCEKYHINTN